MGKSWFFNPFGYISLPTPEPKPNNNVSTVKVKSRSKYHRSKKSPSINISGLHFDYNYSGDISGSLEHLQDIDYSVKIEPSIGKKQSVNISIDATNWTLNQLLSSINSQADGYATVQYNPNNNSFKIIYVSKIRDVAYDAMEQSKKWRDGHKPKPIITPDGVLKYPYGYYQPVIPCKIGMICDIQLGAGEVLRDWAISDIGNWQMYGGNDKPRFAYSGTGKDSVPHILIKPGSAATTTNLVVLTNQRTYDMLLKATDSDYVLTAGFYFPNQIIQGLEDQKQEDRNQALANNTYGANSIESDTNAYEIDISKLNSNDYEITGDDVPWKPTVILDDGEHVYIKFANNLQVSPVLLELSQDDDPDQQPRMLRYWPQPGNMYLVNRVFDKAVLVMGINDQTKKVYITRKKAEVSIWHKIFG